MSSLHDFIVANRDRIIDRVRQRLNYESVSTEPDANLEHGIPVFLSQLTEALAQVDSAGERMRMGVEPDQTIGISGELHGRYLLENGFTVAQVVRGYGDFFQVVTELVSETNVAISAHEFRVLNRCLNGAIVGAVTAFGRGREKDLTAEGTERFGVFVHEVRNLLNAATLSLEVIARGGAGLGGSTGAVLSRSLSALRVLIERSIAEVRLEARVPRLESVSLTEFIGEIEASAAIEAERLGLQWIADSVDQSVMLFIDRELLTSALSNLLQNAFKFTRAHGTVSLTTRVSSDRVLIEVQDECGGLPPGKAAELFRPFVQSSKDRSGLGLGLAIAVRGVRANGGVLYVRDRPGEGCMFVIDLPRKAPQVSAIFRVPNGAGGSPIGGEDPTDEGSQQLRELEPLAG